MLYCSWNELMGALPLAGRVDLIERDSLSLFRTSGKISDQEWLDTNLSIPTASTPTTSSYFDNPRNTSIAPTATRQVPRGHSRNAATRDRGTRRELGESGP